MINLYESMGPTFVGPDLGPKCLQQLTGFSSSQVKANHVQFRLLIRMHEFKSIFIFCAYVVGSQKNHLNKKDLLCT